MFLINFNNTIEVIAPDGFSFTAANADNRPFIDTDSDIDSDFDPETGRVTTSFPLTPFLPQGEIQLNWDAGLVAVDEIFTGTDRRDFIRGSHQDDSILGKGGDDRLNGKRGDDLLLGGDGNDSLLGHRGSDALYGGSGQDRLKGSKANSRDANEVDILSGGSDADKFILGDRHGSYYTNGGDADKAIITDFAAGEDKIQLYGASDRYALKSTESTTNLFLGQELIATINTQPFSDTPELARDFIFVG